MYRALDLFSGIGGFSLGLERTGGFKTVAFCEIEEYPRKVLAKHWPDVPCYTDVRKLSYERLKADGITADVITAGFPCQDISTAGKGAGIEGERSGLWKEVARLTGELRPRYVILENVAALLSRGLGVVLGDLAQIGYDAEWHCIPASALGAWHHRDRFWCVAYPQKSRLERHGRPENTGDFSGKGRDAAEGHSPNDVSDPGHNIRREQLGIERADTQQHESWLCCPLLAYTLRVRQSGPGELINAISAKEGAHWQASRAFTERFGKVWATEPDVGRVANGVPARMDRLKGLGNAVVPQIPELIGRAILEAEDE